MNRYNRNSDEYRPIPDIDGPDFFAPLGDAPEAEDQAYTDAEAAQEALNEAWYEAQAAMWDDDPNPYAGTYSEE